MAYHTPKDEVTRLNRQVGDVGVTAERLAPETANEGPSVAEVHRRLFEIAETSGAGSLTRKLELFAGLLGELDRLLPNTWCGSPSASCGWGSATHGPGRAVIRKARRSVARPVLEAAYNRTSDLGLISRTLGPRVRRGWTPSRSPWASLSAASSPSAFPIRSQ